MRMRGKSSHKKHTVGSCGFPQLLIHNSSLGFSLSQLLSPLLSSLTRPIKHTLLQLNWLACFTTSFIFQPPCLCLWPVSLQSSMASRGLPPSWRLPASLEFSKFPRTESVQFRELPLGTYLSYRTLSAGKAFTTLCTTGSFWSRWSSSLWSKRRGGGQKRKKEEREDGLIPDHPASGH